MKLATINFYAHKIKFQNTFLFQLFLSSKQTKNTTYGAEQQNKIKQEIKLSLNNSFGQNVV